MGPIMLDVNNFNDFYEAWNATMVQKVEGYNSIS